jgi:hypothetical protein
MVAALLRVRKVADRNSPHTVVNDPNTGRAVIISTETGREEPRKLLGVRPEGEAPDETTVGTGFIQRAQAEGWAELVNPRVVYRPSGPADRRWDAAFPPHTFVHADAVVFHFMDGDVRYDVVHQPDKYVASATEYKGKTIDTVPDFSLDDEPVTDQVYSDGRTRVDNFYGLKRS